MVHVRLSLEEIKALREVAATCDHSAPSLCAIIIRAGLGAIQRHPGPFLPLSLEVGASRLAMNEGPTGTSYRRK